MNITITSAKERHKLRDNLGGTRTTRCLKPFILVDSKIFCTLYSVLIHMFWRPERSADVPTRTIGRF